MLRIAAGRMMRRGTAAMSFVACRSRLCRMRTVHRARVQHPRIAEYSGEPERKQRGEGASPGGQAIHDSER